MPSPRLFQLKASAYPCLLYTSRLLPMTVLLLSVAPLTDYRRLRPRLSRAAFVALYGLELAAYQLGVWRGCWRRRTPRPLLPQLSARR